MTQPDWDDERLDAAFHARFDRSAPPALAKDIHVRIAGTSPTRFRVPRVGQPWSLAAAAAVVVFIGAAMFIPAALSLPGASPAPTAASSGGAGPSATPTEQALPGSLFDGALPIVGVREAIALRDSGTDDSEIAVHGWFTPAPPFDCGEPSPAAVVDPLQLRCPDDIVWLTEDAESLIQARNGGYDAARPNGLWLNPDLDGLDTSWFPGLPVPGQDGGPAPIDVVFVGHFDDRRSSVCPQDEIDACRDRFVVDAVARAHGVEPPISEVHEAQGAVSTNHEIAAIVAAEAPDSPIMSATVVDGPTGLAAIEPSLGTGQQNLIDQPILWLVRVLESGRLATYVVVDGSDAIYEMNPEGEAILVGGTPPTPEATGAPTSWPPSGAVIVDLVDTTPVGAPPVRVAIVDASGRLTGAAEHDPNTVTTDGRFGAYGEPGKPGRVNLTWIGGACDSQITVTIGADLGSISFDMGPQPNCDSIGVGRQLVLDFEGSVDVPAIQIGEGTAIAAPSPSSGLGYELDCGPLGPDTCKRNADQIVAQFIGKDLAQQAVSIVFTDGCGSNRVKFGDGTESYTIVDGFDCFATPAPS